MIGTFHKCGIRCKIPNFVTRQQQNAPLIKTPVKEVMTEYLNSVLRALQFVSY